MIRGKTLHDNRIITTYMQTFNQAIITVIEFTIMVIGLPGGLGQCHSNGAAGPSAANS